ncbi:MAG: glycoside hydrolase family 15 protein [Armatimonadetes bacterium]|nr:glycoside hydrolase family 15 protein [Armatimonadota bacterium]MDW8123038.1 glycoside hydrolase family 15 protein [Armatimonadota bacterium]
MAVFQPSAFLGNGRVLISLGRSAELMSFFYPRCDYPNNVREGLSGVFDPEVGFIWLFDHRWERYQEFYSPLLVITRLTSPDRRLRIVVEDVLDEEEPVLQRRWRLEGLPTAAGVRLFHYFELTLGGVEQQQAVQILRVGPKGKPVVTQWFQSVWCAVQGDPDFEGWQCGKSHHGSHNHPKEAMVRGHLSGQSLEIGRVGFAVSTPPLLRGERQSSWSLTLSFGKTKREALARLEVARTKKRHSIPSARSLFLFDNLLGHRPKVEDPKVQLTYRTSAGALDCLWDRRAQAFLAAPEFDPTFEASGGYGFCWFRDAAFVIESLIRLGAAQGLKEFFSFCATAQSEEGYFHQRYWLDGTLAPAWSEDHDCLQLDQTALIVWAVGRWEEETGYLLDLPIWTTCKKALEFLESRLSDGLHASGHDLWETFQGTFTFTQACFVAAFRAGAQMAQARGFYRESQRWQEAAEKAKKALFNELWTGKEFLRGIQGKRPDPTPDASVLGLLFPLNILDLSEKSERKMAEASVNNVLYHLTTATREGGVAVYRFAGDGYAGGMTSTPATLWLGLSCLSFPDRQDWLTIAHKVLTACAHHTTPGGFLAEMFNPWGDGYWAAGHGWSCAWFLVLARRLGTTMGNRFALVRYHQKQDSGVGGESDESGSPGVHLRF